MNSGFNPLLDNSVPWTIEKIKLLDELVKFFYDNPSHPNITQANQILTQLKENTVAWLATDSILKIAQDFRTKFFALQGLEGLILYRWKDLSDKERNIIRNFIVEMVVGMGRNIDNTEYQQIVRKANQILIQILKQEWETSSKEFILKICNMSKQDPNICENCFDILKILSEEILDSFKHQMKINQIRGIRELYQNEFATIYQLCIIVIQDTLQNSQSFRLSLIKSCLDALSAYLYWLPLNLVFKSDLIGLLLQAFELKDVQLLCVKILTEIVSLNEIFAVDKMVFQEIKQKIIELYSNFMERLNNYITPETNLLAQRTQLMKLKNPSVGFFNSFSKQIALFLSAFMKIHLSWIEHFLNELNESDQGILINLIKKGFQYLVHLSELQGHTFRICVDFWNDFTSSLLKKNGINNHIGQNFNAREMVYHPVVLEVSGIMILKMTRPPEVTVVVDDHGKLIEDVPFDPEGNSLYDRMKELMLNLTIIDWKEIKYLIGSKLEEQLNKSPWNFHNLNSLYWTIGSISQNIENSANQTFVFDILRRLFDLVHQCQETEQRFLTAINFIYLVGQYSTFFKTDWVLLESITEKLIDFMSQASGGIEKMAANTFLKMAKTCKEQYLAAPVNSTQYNSTEPYIAQLIFKISSIIPNLQVNQRLILYEGIGNILAAELNLEKKQYLINLVLQEHWEIWEAILKEIEINLDILKNEECIEKLFWIIKIHEVFASTICQDFFQSLTRIYLNMLKVYLLYSGILNKEIQIDPKVAPTHHLTKKMKNLRKEIIILIKTYIQKCNDNDIIIADILPSLNDLFDDYFNDNIIIREHEILLILVTIIERFGGNVFQLTSNLMGNVFQALLSTPNIDTNPVLLTNTIKLIAAITRHCFQDYLGYAKAYWPEGASAEAEQLEFFLKCVLLGLGFDMNVQKQSLETIDLIIRSLPLNINLVNLFCKEYYMIALQEVLTLVSNPNHKDAFHQQAEVLLLLIQLINGNYGTVSLVDNQGLLNNQEYIYQTLISFFSKGGFNATGYVQELMNPDQSNTEQFKVILRNLLMESFQYDPMSKEEGEQD